MLKKLPKEVRVAINICLAGIDSAIKHANNDKELDVSLNIRNALTLEVLQFNIDEDYSSFQTVTKYFSAMRDVFDNAIKTIETNQNKAPNPDSNSGSERIKGEDDDDYK